MNDCNSGNMDPSKEIKTLLKEAQLYESQGLLKDAKIRYENAIEIVKSNETLASKDQLLEGIEKKLQSLDAATSKAEKKAIITEISARDKDLIKRLFSTASADDNDTNLLEGAVALAKFGQFDRAIVDFEELLETSPLRIVAAKHILRCHIAIRALHDPMAQFQKWVSTGYFGKEELAELSTFLHKTYGLSVEEKENREQDIPEQGAPEQDAPTASDVGTTPETVPESEQSTAPPPKPAFDPDSDAYVDVLDTINTGSGETTSASAPQEVPGAGSTKKQSLQYEEIVSDASSDYVDYISSIGVPVKGGMTDLPVNLQTGSIVNLIVPANNKLVIEKLKKGAQIEGAKLNSPISVNTGNCIVVSVARIDMGPKKGDYSIDLKIES